MNHCTGLQGKRCSCGNWHVTESAGSLLASRAVWIGAVLSVIAWGLLAGWVLT